MKLGIGFLPREKTNTFFECLISIPPSRPDIHCFHENFVWYHFHYQFTLWKLRKFTLNEKIFRQITYLVISLVKLILSRNFCQKCVRMNFHYFHTVQFINFDTIWLWDDIFYVVDYKVKKVPYGHLSGIIDTTLAPIWNLYNAYHFHSENVKWFHEKYAVLIFICWKSSHITLWKWQTHLLSPKKNFVKSTI